MLSSQLGSLMKQKQEEASVCACVYMCIHVYICEYMLYVYMLYVCVHICMCMCAHVCLCLCVHICVCMCMCICVCSTLSGQLSFAVVTIVHSIWTPDSLAFKH